MAGLLEIYADQPRADTLRKGTDRVKSTTNCVSCRSAASGEIGMNFNLYGYGRARPHGSMVDLGIGFADDRLRRASTSSCPTCASSSSSATILDGHRPDPRPRGPSSAPCPICGRGCGCPIWCTPFTAAVLRAKLRETDFARDVPIRIVRAGPGVQARPASTCRFDPRHPLDPGRQRAGDPRRRSARCCTPATGSSTRTPLVGARDRRRRARRRWARRACWRSCATAPTCCRRARSGSEAEVRDSLTKLIADQPSRVA